MTTVIVATVAAVVAATLAGWLLTRRSGNIREIHSESAQGAHADTADLGLSRSGPTVVHFSAPWCGPCDRVRRVVGQVCEDLGDVAHVEVDLDANPATARLFSVLSLPTT
ncbi:MAG TPA: thioredoxin family protein, partial [Mycobacterium sp.]|nr:thioredoxin family protein [Mycobacterium sp.]